MIATQAETLSCQDFCEGWIENDLYRLIDELYWDGGCCTESMFNFMIKRAKEMGVILSDADAWAYDDYFYNWYRCTEKGLS